MDYRAIEHDIELSIAEEKRLQLARRRLENWQRWGPYLSERQWGTVREDYSDSQDPWYFFPHDHARSRAYRWGEDGLLGICDRQCRLCFAPAFWNGRDAILKERLYGVPGPEGNHGEDVKEYYFYLDSTPTHSYMQALYKYPHAKFPYDELAETNRRRGRDVPEYELLDTGIFEGDAYFDCFIEYAKASPDDLLIQLTIHNRGRVSEALHLLPQFWFRNTWAWGPMPEEPAERPEAWLMPDAAVGFQHASLGDFICSLEVASKQHVGLRPEWLFTDNETNPHRHPGRTSSGRYFKDAFHEYIAGGNIKAVNPRRRGTKVGAYFTTLIEPGEPLVVRLRLSRTDVPGASASEADPEHAPRPDLRRDFDDVLELRKAEADEFYARRIPANLDGERTNVSRQAYAGLLWTKQFYHYVVERWLEGDPNWPKLPDWRPSGRNGEWKHLFNRDVISMPDKWEYPWYAAWDLAFHMVPMARIDMDFAKNQMILFLREWYMHPNGQLPAYEWALSDVNPPVHAWACWQIYEMSGPPGGRDKDFLKRVFMKLLLNFTWWVNRKDVEGQNVFSGGFLGLDNIGVFDRNKPLPGGAVLHQADATAWMAFFCGYMLQIALELATEAQAYGDMASKFFEHYVAIGEAINTLHGTGLWDEADGFYYDHIQRGGESTALRVRSLVGLMPLCTPVLLFDDAIAKLPGFQRRLNWFLDNKPELSTHMTYLERSGGKDGTAGLRLLAIPSVERFKKLLTYMLAETEFLSDYGIRSMSAVHREQPFVFDYEGGTETVRYVPGESDSYFFGGNSNWRGPIWFPINYLIIQALRTYSQYYKDSLKVECPVGSGKYLNLQQVADEIERRLVSLFLAGKQPAPPCHGESSKFSQCPHWGGMPLFYEYFHGDNGRGLGASHQTGWTALVATMLEHQAVCNSRLQPVS